MGIAYTKEGITLRCGLYSAHFLPEKGMNLTSLMCGEKEVIDQNTRPLFEQRFAGLGAMIGPHFHYRPSDSIPTISDESLFPHLKVVKAKGAKDPFSHGIGRYAPWKVIDRNECSISCELFGTDRWQGVLLKELEGQDFKMRYKALLTDKGLQIELGVKSERASVVGLHTYYALEKGHGSVKACVNDQYNEGGVFKPIPSNWNYKNHRLVVELPQIVDYGFIPYPTSKQGAMVLETGQHHVHIDYSSSSEEHSWQLWQPEGVSFVCIEPISARNPRRCTLNESSIKVIISIHEN